MTAVVVDPTANELARETLPSKAPARSRAGIGGPRTVEGKSRSARNALKHGLRAKTLLPDDLAAAVARRTEEFVAELRPESSYQRWLIGQAALAAARIDRCAELALIDLQRTVDRAATCWDDDRRMEVEDQAARLSRDPARIVRALRRSKAGAEWMIERWESLGEAVRRHGGWDDAQRRLALDLLGVPATLRSCWLDLPEDATPDELAELADERAAALRADVDAVLNEVDESERAMASVAMPLHEDGPTRALKRYETECRRALRWALNELQRLQHHSTLTDDVPDAPTPSERCPGSSLDLESPVADDGAVPFESRQPVEPSETRFALDPNTDAPRPLREAERSLARNPARPLSARSFATFDRACHEAGIEHAERVSPPAPTPPPIPPFDPPDPPTKHRSRRARKARARRTGNA